MAIIYPSSKARKERIFKLLDDATATTALVEGGEHADAVAEPDLHLPWFRSGVLAATLGFLLLAFSSQLSEPYGWSLGALFFASLLHSIALLVQQTRRLRSAAGRLQPSLDELRASRDALIAYLSDLDIRTRKYFHCVTNTKVTTYCILKQILLSLDQRISLVQPLLSRPTAESLSEAEVLLTQDLAFREGFLKNTGKERSVAPDRIPAIVQGLRDELEQSLAELEKEIVRTQVTAGGLQIKQAEAIRQ